MGIIVIGSTRGSSLDGIVKCDLKDYISMIISDKETAPILQKARKLGIKSYYQDATGLSRQDYDEKMMLVIKDKNPDLILLVGYMRIISKQFVEEFKGKILNIHPSLLPKHSGLMDLDVHNAVLKSGDKKSGCTIHYVTEQVDAGGIVVKLECDVEENDTAQTLKEKVQDLEKKAWVAVVKQYYTEGKI